MRTTCVVALVASLMIFTGCTAIKGPQCGGQWDSFCEEGDCGGGCGIGRGGFTLPSLGLNRLGGAFAGGCDSGCCSTDANFSDYNYDCGPMCGAYLNDGQTAGGCGCDSCQVGQSYVGGQWNNWFGNSGGISLPSIPRPFAGASCRGLGSMVGCFGCNECGGGGAIGSSHSACATGNDCGGDVACGPDGCGALAGGRLAGRIRGFFFRPNGSPHPYGGEQPHTGSPADGNGFGGASAPTYAYPYYTTRGPRDFLMMNPPSIGR